MFYQLLKIPAKIAFLLYCRSVRINNKKILEEKGPLLIACNHPNSFLDAVIIATLFKRPIYSLTRGDVYSSPFFSRILTSLKMLPVYRTSEGKENVTKNYTTFEHCKNIFKENGIVLIFCEGLCVNEWHLRPLKKGTARLAISSWEEGIDLKILPAGINYQAYRTYGKNIELNFGEILTKKEIDLTNGYGRSIINFNEKLKLKLQPLVAEIDPGNRSLIKKRFFIEQGSLKKVLLFIPAMIGWCSHALLYSLVQQYTWNKASHTGHYDSILIALLFILYPFYLLLISLLMFFILPGWWWSIFILLPVCAWSYLQLKRQLDHPTPNPFQRRGTKSP